MVPFHPSFLLFFYSADKKRFSLFSILSLFSQHHYEKVHKCVFIESAIQKLFRIIIHEIVPQTLLPGTAIGKKNETVFKIN